MVSAAALKLHAKQMVASLLSGTRIARECRPRVLVYHSFVANRVTDPAQMTTPVPLFDDQMRFLTSNGYRVVRAAELIRDLRAGRAIPDRTVTITIDDGFEDLRLAAPVLERYGLNATVFVLADALEGRFGLLRNEWTAKYLTLSDARALVATSIVEFGSHGATHRRLPETSDVEMWNETGGAKKRLEEILARPIDLFAYPFGSFDAIDGRARAAVARAGHSGGFSGIMGTLTQHTDPFVVPRSRVSWAEDLPSFERLLNGAYDWYRLVQRMQAR